MTRAQGGALDRRARSPRGRSLPQRRGHPEVLDKRRRQQEGQRELIDLTIDQPAVSAALTRVCGRASVGCKGVRDEARKRQVIEQAVDAARAAAIPADAVAAMWETLVEASIAYEMAEWDRRRTDGDGA